MQLRLRPNLDRFKESGLARHGGGCHLDLKSPSLGEPDIAVLPESAEAHGHPASLQASGSLGRCLLGWVSGRGLGISLTTKLP